VALVRHINVDKTKTLFYDLAFYVKVKCNELEVTLVTLHI